jgi:vacuolar-type H+-ATPase subunit E/Vma4
MSIDNIKKQVLDAARAEADDIVSTAQDAANERVEEARTEHAARKRNAVEAAEAALQRRLGQAVTAKRAANKLAILSQRSKLLDDAFEQAVRQATRDRDASYAAWLNAELESVADHAGELRPAAADRERLEAALEEMKADGRASGLTLSEENTNALGGFVLAGDAFDLDHTLDAQLDALKTELLPELARRAFGTEDN